MFAGCKCLQCFIASYSLPFRFKDDSKTPQILWKVFIHFKNSVPVFNSFIPKKHWGNMCNIEGLCSCLSKNIKKYQLPCKQERKQSCQKLMCAHWLKVTASFVQGEKPITCLNANNDKILRGPANKYNWYELHYDFFLNRHGMQQMFNFTSDTTVLGKTINCKISCPKPLKACWKAWQVVSWASNWKGVFPLFNKRLTIHINK